MTKKPNRILVLAVLAASGVGAATACFSEKEGPTDIVEGACSIDIGGPVVGQNTTVVAIRDFAFHPAQVTIKRGTKVTWVNCDEPAVADHTSTADGGQWNSPLLDANQTFTRQFDATGSFAYHCTPHPSMQGTVIVQD
jgi:plastocyanin